MNYKYMIVFHTPVGVFTTKIKDDPEEVILEKMDRYFDVDKIEATTIDNGHSQVYISADILKQSVIEFNYDV